MAINIARTNVLLYLGFIGLQVAKGIFGLIAAFASGGFGVIMIPMLFVATIVGVIACTVLGTN